MSSALDMSLDDIIKNSKKSSSSGGRGRGLGRSGPGPARRSQNRAANRPNPYSMPKAADYGVYTDQIAAFSVPAASRVSSIETGTKLYISNLDYGVSNDDIKELFSEVGDIKRYSIHYDRSGRSKGTAEVVFSRKDHALAAVKRYNNVQLDGKPMKIAIVGTNIEKPVAFPPVAHVNFGNPSGIPQRLRGRGVPAGRPHGGGGRGQSRGGRGRGRGRDEKVSVEDLDADLDKYHREAMQVN
ncbi:THO complex subunit 4B-like [Asparagus officinalis]|nr:THO complex subunit 4B-like [Asparagus officinalis]